MMESWLVAAAKRLIVVDDQDRPRTLIGQDPGW